MQTIVVLTDFSAAAHHATAYAATIAKEAGAHVLLLHVYELPLVTSELPMLLVSADDIKKGVEEQLLKAKTKAEESCAGVLFTTEGRLGYLTEAALDVTLHQNAFCIVAGSKKLGGLDAFLTGDTLRELRTESGFPLLLVPEQAALFVPKNIVLAVDEEFIDAAVVERVTSFVQSVKAHLHLVHVNTNNEAEVPAETYRSMFAPLPITYNVVQHQNIVAGIQGYLVQTAADLLVVLPRKHGFLERLFTQPHSAGLAQELTVPLLCLSAKSQ